MNNNLKSLMVDIKLIDRALSKKSAWVWWKFYTRILNSIATQNAQKDVFQEEEKTVPSLSEKKSISVNLFCKVDFNIQTHSHWKCFVKN